MLPTTVRISHSNYNGLRYVLVDKDFWRVYIWTDIAVLRRRDAGDQIFTGGWITLLIVEE